MTSETVINRLFHIHQGFILICNGLDNFNSSFNNINEDINYNVDISQDNGVDNIILSSGFAAPVLFKSYPLTKNVIGHGMFCNNYRNCLFINNYYRVKATSDILNQRLNGNLSIFKSNNIHDLGIYRYYSSKNLNSKDFDFIFDKFNSNNNNKLISVSSFNNINIINYNNMSIFRDFKNDRIY